MNHNQDMHIFRLHFDVVWTRCVLFLILLCAGYPLWASPAEVYAQKRQALIQEIASDVQATAFFLGRDRLNPGVLSAMNKVLRHEFVPQVLRVRAYLNQPLPIGHGQTISQPYIVAIMTDMLEPQPDHQVLEIGTGSGYQAAVLAELVQQVYSIEIIEPLGRAAAERLKTQGYNNVTVRVGDGYYGWPEKGPFDSIVVTAAASHVPPPLIKQLKPGGRMVIPVGSPFLTQQLLLITKQSDGRITTRQMMPVRFVPLTGQRD